jgi:predicted oxidoreductase
MQWQVRLGAEDQGPLMACELKCVTDHDLPSWADDLDAAIVGTKDQCV